MSEGEACGSQVAICVVRVNGHKTLVLTHLDSRSHNVSDCSAAYVHPSFSWPGVEIVAQNSRGEAARIRAPVLILRAEVAHRKQALTDHGSYRRSRGIKPIDEVNLHSRNYVGPYREELAKLVIELLAIPSCARDKRRMEG